MNNELNRFEKVLIIQVLREKIAKLEESQTEASLIQRQNLTELVEKIERSME